MKLKLLQYALIPVFLTVMVTKAQDSKTKDISGTIVSAEKDKTLGVDKGEPIIGATIKIKGTGKGTATDIDGNFKLANVPIGSILEISYAGFKNTEIKVEEGKDSYSVDLKTDSKELDEVVAVGYGVQKKRDVTGATVSVNEKDMKTTINSGLDQALQGRTAGVTVTQTSGSPGAAANVNIRGVGSVNGSQPLYVVDGVPIEYQNLNLLNPGDIETMEVLKDASAAAIYGARAANGVVIITTKRGKDGKGKVEFDAMYGQQEVWKKLNVLNADQFKEFNNLTTPGISQNNSDWQNALWQPGQIQNYNLKASGGNQYGTYAISLGYFQNTGTLKRSDFDRYSLRVNSDITPKKWLKFSESLSLSRTQSNDGAGFGAIASALTANPLIPIYDPLNQPGGFGGPTNNTLFGANNTINPVAQNESNTSTRVQTRVLGNVSAEIDFGHFLGLKPIEGLKFKTNLGVDLYSAVGRSVSNPFFAGPGDRSQNVKSISDSRNNNYSWLLDHILSYSKTIEKHEFTVLAGISSQKFFQSSNSAQAVDYPTSINTVGATLNPASAIIGGEDQEYALLGYLARVNYVYAGKYMATFNIRRDGSSRFGSQTKYGTFPSFSLGWRLSDENFLKSAQWISDLKVRFGWGQTGNQEIPGNYLYAQQLYPDIIRYVIGRDQNLVSGQAPTRGLANPFLRWETVTQSNFGVDFAIFQNSLQFNLDLFEKNSTGILIPVPIPATSGVTDAPFFGTPNFFTNAGSVRNRGIELAVTYRNEKNPFKFSITPNGTLIRNEVVSLEGEFGGGKPNISEVGGISRTETGLPIGSFYGWVTDGIVQNQAEADSYYGNLSGTHRAIVGDLKFKDLNGDGKLDDLDRTYLGKPIPTFSYGVTLEARYQGFDFRVFLQGVADVQVYNSFRGSLERNNRTASTPEANQSVTVLNRWSPTNTSSEMPAIRDGDPAQNNRPSNRWVERGDYMRIKSVQLGYSFPEALLKKMFRTEDGVVLRLYLQAQNLLTFTAYQGFDPEISNYDRNGISSVVSGFDFANYPQPRTFSGGLQFSF